MKKQKVWHWSVYKDGKLIYRFSEGGERRAYMRAAAIGGKVKKGFTLK